MKPGDPDDLEYAKYQAKIDGKIKRYVDQGKDTQSLYSHVNDRGVRVYDPERLALHREIVDGILARYPDAGTGEALIMGGLAGAGKSSFLKRDGAQLGIEMDASGNSKSHIVINPDDIKSDMIERGMVPRYAGLKPGETAALTHEESSDITKLLTARALSTGRNVIFDITLAGKDPEKLRRKYIDPLNANGYHVTGAFVESKVEDSLSRATTRHQKPTASGVPTMNGRYVPLHLVREAKSDDPNYLSVNHKNFFEILPQLDSAYTVGYADRALKKEK